MTSKGVFAAPNNACGSGDGESWEDVRWVGGNGWNWKWEKKGQWRVELPIRQRKREGAEQGCWDCRDIYEILRH